MSEPLSPPALDDCWNRIGVWGRVQPRCSRLEQVVHCRHCPVYADAAARQRDRPLPEGYAEEWRRHYAAALPPRRSRTREHRGALIFRVGREPLALPLVSVDEVMGRVDIHRLSGEHPGAIIGLASVHGRLRPCLDLGVLLDLDAVAPDAARGNPRYPRMIVIRRQESVFVFAVDEVLGTRRFAPARLAPIPDTLARALKRFSLGLITHGEYPAGLLNSELLFDVLTGKTQA